MEFVNEGSTSVLSISFYDENGSAIIPYSVDYRIDDESGEEIKKNTSVTPGETVEITISSTENRILNKSKPIEKRIVSVKYTWSGGSKVGYDHYEYIVRNLDFADQIE